MVKLLDYRNRWAELDASSNPFAVVIQAHLQTQATRHDAEDRYRAKLALAKSLYRRGWGREDIQELFRVIDWLLRLPEELEEPLWSDIQTYEEVEKMPYVTSVERIGIRKGLQQGLQHQRHGLLRQARKRFGAEVAKRSEPLLECIDDPERLEHLGEALLDSANGEAWLRVLQQQG